MCGEDEGDLPVVNLLTVKRHVVWRIGCQYEQDPISKRTDFSYSSWHDRRTKVAQTGLGSSVGAVQSVRVTYVLVVNDHPLLTGGLVGAQVLVNAPVTAPSLRAQPRQLHAETTGCTDQRHESNKLHKGDKLKVKR